MKLFDYIKKYNIFTFEGRINRRKRYLEHLKNLSKSYEETIDTIDKMTKEFNHKIDKVIKDCERMKEIHNQSDCDNTKSHNNMKDKTNKKFISIKEMLSQKFKDAYSCILPIQNMGITKQWFDESGIEYEIRDLNTIGSKEPLFEIFCDENPENETAVMKAATLVSKLLYVPKCSTGELLKSFIKDFDLKLISFNNFGINGSGAVVETPYDDRIWINVDVFDKTFILTITYTGDEDDVEGTE